MVKSALWDYPNLSRKKYHGPSRLECWFDVTIAKKRKKKVNAQQITSKYCDTGAIELPILGDDQTMQIYGRFEGFPFNSALFGFII